MMKEFKNKFMELYDTPIVHKPFLPIIGPDGLSPDADKIIMGINVLPPCLDPYIVEVSNALKWRKQY